MSTSISTVTLSDVYTLSWDLPSSCGSRAGGFEEVPDEEEENKGTKKLSPDQSEPREPLDGLITKAAAERTDQDPGTAKDLQSDPDLNTSVQQEVVREPEPVSGTQTKESEGSTMDHFQSEKVDKSETDKDSVMEQKNKTKNSNESKAEKPQVASSDKKENEQSVQNEAQPSSQDGDSQEESAPQQAQQDQAGPDSTDGPAPDLIPASSYDQVTAEAVDPNSTSILPSSSATDEVRLETLSNSSDKSAAGPAAPPPPSNVQSSSSLSPFKIQKVKSSDLKSFQRIVGDEGGKPAKVDRASSLGTGLNLSVPSEGLEIISDSEEGDAASIVLPDWLKVGEFVTVGPNKSGTVRYVGPTDFAEGTWVGVELEAPAGEIWTCSRCICTPLTSFSSQITNMNLSWRVSRKERRLGGREALLPL